MDQDDSGLGAWSTALKAEHGDVQTHTLNLDELAGRRMGGLEACDTERGRRREHAEEHQKHEQIKYNCLGHGYCPCHDAIWVNAPKPFGTINGQ